MRISYLIIILFFSLFSLQIFACSCAPLTLSLKSSFQKSPFVFIGLVLGSKTNIKNKKNKFNAKNITTFKIIKSYKNYPSLKEIKITHSTSGISCGVNFMNNQKYLIFTYLTNKKKLRTDICSIKLIKYHSKKEPILKQLSKLSLVK